MTRKIHSQIAIAKKTWHFARWLVPMVSLPVLAGIVAVGWLGYRELRATQVGKNLDASLGLDGTTSGDAWLDKKFRESTQAVGTALWSKVYLLTTHANFHNQKDLPIVGGAALPRQLDRNQLWEANERVGEYLSEMRPVIDLIHQAAQTPTPVWQPIAFNGFATLLPESQAARESARILQLEAEYALYNGDSQRAMKAINSLHGTAESINWNICIVTQLVYTGIRDIYLRTIQRSLHTDVWSSEQIEKLMGQINQPVNVAEAFRHGMRSEQAWVESMLDSSKSFFAGMRLVVFPSVKLELRQHYQGLQSLADSSNVRLSTQLAEYEERWGIDRTSGSSGMLASYFFPVASAYATGLEASEQLRQISFVALAIKRFGFEYQRAPVDLSELSKIGLSPKDWTIAGVGRLGYSVEGEQAFVWGLRHNESSVATTRPKTEIDDIEDVSHMAIIVVDSQQ